LSPTDNASIIVCPHCGKKNRVHAAAAGAPHCGSCGKSLPWLAESDEQTFSSVVEQSPLPVLVDFWAPWCGPCRMVEPVVRQMAQELAGSLKVVRVNSDDVPELSQRFQIVGIPALLLFDRGQLRDRMTGAVPAATMRSWLQARLPAPKPS
jgi:thioredoxin 2